MNLEEAIEGAVTFAEDVSHLWGEDEPEWVAFFQKFIDNRKKETSQREKDIKEVFEHWRDGYERVTERKGGPRMKLNGVRKSKINARLDEGYTAEHLKEAIDGMLMREYNVENGYLDVELALRHQQKVEMFRTHYRLSKAQPKTEATAQDRYGYYEPTS